MNKIKREIQIKYPDGTYHTALVYRADLTYDGRVILSYYDVTAGNVDSYSEIINLNGTWYKNPTHLEWSQYEFNEFDPLFSNSVIQAVENRVEMANLNINLPKSEKVATTLTAQASPPPPPDPHRIKPIKLVLHANEGESIVNLHPKQVSNGLLLEQTYNLSSFMPFFTPGSLSDNMKEHFSRINLSEEEKEDILAYIKQNIAYNGKFDISSIGDFSVETRTNTRYIISISSCRDWDLFYRVLGADTLTVDESSVAHTSFPDYLSSALHYELPLGMMTHGNYYSNGVSNDEEPRRKK